MGCLGNGVGDPECALEGAAGLQVPVSGPSQHQTLGLSLNISLLRDNRTISPRQWLKALNDSCRGLCFGGFGFWFWFYLGSLWGVLGFFFIFLGLFSFYVCYVFPFALFL